MAVSQSTAHRELREGKDMASRISFRGLSLFRRQVLERAHQLARLGKTVQWGLSSARQTKIRAWVAGPGQPGCFPASNHDEPVHVGANEPRPATPGALEATSVPAPARQPLH